MTHEPRRIPFEDFVREVQAIFDMLASQKEPVMVERAGRLFRLEAEHLHEPRDIWAGYNPERMRQALRKSAGALRGVDREDLLQDLREQRAQDSPGRPA